MPLEPLIDLSRIDLENIAVPREEIEAVNPQRHEFQQMVRVCHLDLEERIIAGVRDLEPDEFWVRGHMPGRPIFPGVLMIEAAAQLSTVCTARLVGMPDTYGFGGTDKVRFRKMLTVGDRLVIVARGENVSQRRSRYTAQGFCDGELAFQASIFGIALPREG